MLWVCKIGRWTDDGRRSIKQVARKRKQPPTSRLGCWRALGVLSLCLLSVQRFSRTSSGSLLQAALQVHVGEEVGWIRIRIDYLCVDACGAFPQAQSIITYPRARQHSPARRQVASRYRSKEKNATVHVKNLSTQIDARARKTMAMANRAPHRVPHQRPD